MLQDSTTSMAAEDIDNGIAIVGMAGRFPGAKNIKEFWNNLMQAKDAWRQFTEEEVAPHVPDDVLTSKDFMRSGYTLDNADFFDAEFFGIPPRQARLMDPQHRLFLECAWEALEDAGYARSEDRGTVGVYASGALSTYLLHLSDHLTPWEPSSYFEALLGNDKDYLASRVCYKLGLNGPGVVVQSACSSSMLAIATACQSLQDYQTDIALAGGVNVEYPQEHGCICKEDDGFISPHGKCRAFDADASGIVQGNGLGIVVLKRLSDALKEQDTVYAVIRGFAVNNDGADKVGFTAPSVSGQREAIAEALYMAEVPPQSISYVEAHGTGTALGDPIEITALASAYDAPWPAGCSCAIGSVKTNIGHLNTAAGVASFIKTALALKHKHIPASLHFNSPNPAIPFESTPFRVNTETMPWAGPLPRRAGVSSFGFGGTNVHMILEEAPAVPEVPHKESLQLLPVSAKTDSSLIQSLEALADHLKHNKDVSLSDVAYTLQCGRADHACRVAFVCRNMDDAVLQIGAASKLTLAKRRTVEHTCGVWFPDVVSRHANIANNTIAQDHPAWSAVVEKCKEHADRHSVYQSGFGEEVLAHITEQVCTASFLRSRGISPDRVCAQSIGGYAAAVFVDALSLSDALDLAAYHADWLRENPAASPQQCAEALRSEIGQYSVQPASIPVFSHPDTLHDTAAIHDAVSWSNLFAGNTVFSGMQPVATAEEQMPSLWVLCAGSEEYPMVEECRGAGHTVVQFSGHAQENVEERFTRMLAEMWQVGLQLHWNTAKAYPAYSRRIPLPTYFFERQRFQPDTNARRQQKSKSVTPASPPVTEWFHTPSWNRISPVGHSLSGTWLVFLPGGESADIVAEEIRANVQDVVEVHAGTSFAKTAHGYQLDFQDKEALELLFTSLSEEGRLPEHVLFMRHTGEELGTPHRMAEAMRSSASGLAALASYIPEGCRFSVVTSDLFAVTGTETINPSHALLAGPVGTIAAEYPGVSSLLIDVESASFSTRENIRLLLQEAAGKREELLPGKQLALRNGYTWGRCFAPALMSPSAVSNPPLRHDGVYLITGGLGGIGLALAKHLAQRFAPKLVLTTSGSFPQKDEWASCMADGRSNPALLTRLEKLSALEQSGAQVMVLTADAGCEDAMQNVFTQAEKQFGPINGVFHAAGVSGNGLLEQQPLPDAQSNFNPKVMGTIALEKLCRRRTPDFILLCSSLAVFGGLRGTADYISANAFMDAWAEQHAGHDGRFISVNWNTWNNTGMAAFLPETRDIGSFGDVMEADDGVEACMMALASGRKRLAVCTRRIESLLQETMSHADSGQPDKPSAASAALPDLVEDAEDSFRHPRPDIPQEYIAPRNAVEQTLADIWAELLELEAVGVEDPFLDIGGDSLMALTLDTELRKIFPTKLPLNLVLNHGTVTKMAEYLLSDEENSDETLRIADIYQQVASLEGNEVEEQLALINEEER